MSSEQIDDAFEKVESVSYEQVIAYDEDLEDYLKKAIRQRGIIRLIYTPLNIILHKK